jgi:hypothetical protein
MCVSVVISVWNRVKEIQLAIESIVKQDYKDIELIIVDNHSADGTVKFLEEYNYPSCWDVNIFSMPHSNFSAMETLNVGFRKATAPYILVMDDDAYLSSETDLSRLVALIDANPDVAIVATNVQDANGNVAIQFKDINFNTVTMQDFDRMEKPFDYVDFSGAAALFRRSMVKEAGFYDEDLFIYWNEADLALKMLANGHRVLYAPDIRPVHLASLTNRVHCRNHFYYIRNGNRIINEHLGIRERLVLIPLRTAIYSIKYVRECKPGYRMMLKLVWCAAKSWINIFRGKRVKYADWNTHLWVRRVYTRFFWKDLYFQIFKV